MNRNDRSSKSNAEDLFAAVSRLEAGEPIPDILASYPSSMHDELLEMFAIVQVAEQIRTDPVPRPSAARRAAAKRTFLATAAQMREAQQPQMMSTQVAPVMPQRVKSRSAARRAARRATKPWERFTSGLQNLFSSRALHLAPLIATLLLVLFSTTTLVTLAQSAVPGDLAYSLKQWIRKQELELAPAGQRDLVRQEQEKELAQDVAKAANRADANSAVIQAEDTQIYYGRTGRLLKVGGLTVMDLYQPDANVEVFQKMEIVGDLQPGAQVELDYQILPGQSATVQGIALTVVAPPDENALIEIDVPANELPQAGTCNVSQPQGWVPYNVRLGDNLTFLANRGGTTISKIAEVNCLESEIIVIGAQLYVPADSLKTDLPLLQCSDGAPKGWLLYEIQAGDNLSRLAERSGVTVEEIMEANCLESDTIIIGDKFYLPPSAATE